MAKPKVVLVHGFMIHNSMDRFAIMLQKNGWEVENFKYNSRHKTIEAHGKDLVKRLNEITVDDRPIHFITFSLGGLVLNSAINEDDCPVQAKQDNKVVLIAPPINGSKVARTLGKFSYVRKLFGNFSGQQLYGRSEEEFTSVAHFPKDIPILVISGTCGFNPVLKGRNDGKVSVDESCPHFPHSHQYVFAGHSWISKHVLTLNLAVDFLEDNVEYRCCSRKKS